MATKATSRATPVTSSLRKMPTQGSVTKSYASPKATAVPTATTPSGNGTYNEILRDVEFHWVRLATPVDNYAGDAKQYEVQVRVPKKRAAELEVYGKVKEQEGGKVSINFYKDEYKKDGTLGKKPDVVDAAREPLDPRVVGNGSIGNIKLMRRPYQITHPKTGKVTKEGIATAISAVQITKLVKYEGGKGGNLAGFDVEGESFNEAPAGDSDF